MAKRKFKNQLVEQMKQEEREKEHQESLKERYDIEEDVVVVEKTNTIKFLLKTMLGGARLIIAILVFILALIGLTALIYPDSRSLLIRQGLQVWQEFLRLLERGCEDETDERMENNWDVTDSNCISMFRNISRYRNGHRRRYELFY